MVSGSPVCGREPTHVLVVDGAERRLSTRLSNLEAGWRVSTTESPRIDTDGAVDCIVVDAREVSDRRLGSIASRTTAPLLAIVADREDAVTALERGVDDVFILEGAVEPTLLERRVRSVIAARAPPWDETPETARSATAAPNARERELSRQRERLAVLHRVLRHDVRTSANLLLGTADFVREGVGHPDQRADEIEEIASRIVRLSDTVRRLASAIGDDAPATEVDLTAVLRTRLTALGERFPSATVTTTLRPDVVVESDTHLEAAFDHLLENAVVHTDDGDLSVSLERDERAGEAVVTISDDGPGIPDGELAVLEDGTETALDHSSGLGLWVATWIVDAANGTVSFDSGPERGTTATVRLPLATGAECGGSDDGCVVGSSSDS